MTPPAAAAAAPRTRTRKQASPPRRVSGPGRARTAPQAAPPRLVWRVGGAVHTIAEHRWLERLISGRAWIAIVGIGLIGIVFMQVSMLRMNAGIGRSVERAGVLERENSAIRASISELSSGDRIAAEAAKLGLVLPASTPRFLDARTANAANALKAMTAPGVGIVAMTPATNTTAPATTSTTPTLAGTSVAPTTATAPPTTTSTTATPATQQPTTQQPTTPTTTTTSPTTQTTTPAPTTTSQPQQQQTTQPAAQPAATTSPQATGGAEAGGPTG